MTKKILIVDDEPDIRKTLKDIVSNFDVTFSEASDGETCLQETLKNIPDLILLDVMMPGMKTKEILEKLQQNPSTKKVPVILVTVMRFSEKELKTMLQKTQIVDYIAKPFDVSRVLAAVKKYV